MKSEARTITGGSLLDGDHCRPEAVFLERSVLCLAGGIFALQLVEDGTAQHSVPLAMNEDDALLTFVFVLLHHFAELVQLVVQHFPVAHAPCVVQQGVDVEVYFYDVLLAVMFGSRFRFRGCVHGFLLHQGGLQIFGRNIDLFGGTVVLHDVIHQGGRFEEVRLLEGVEFVEFHRVDA